MTVLLDECLPIAFRHSFPGHDVHSAEWAGFKGMKIQTTEKHLVTSNVLTTPGTTGSASSPPVDQGRSTK
jgi:hypothetical protein